jgi:ribosomal protein S24E
MNALKRRALPDGCKTGPAVELSSRAWRCLKVLTDKIAPTNEDLRNALAGHLEPEDARRFMMKHKGIGGKTAIELLHYATDKGLLSIEPEYYI